LLEILEDESISVIHHSFTEFLRDKTRRENPNAFPVLSLQIAHKMLAVVSLKYLDTCKLPQGAVPVGDEGKVSSARLTIHSNNKNKSKSSERSIFNSGSETRATSDPDSDEDAEDYEPDHLDSKFAQVDENNQQSAIIQNMRIDYPLLDYAIKNLQYHVGMAGLNDPIMLDTLDKYFSLTKPAFSMYLLSQWEGCRLVDVLPIHVASYLGWTAYVAHLLKYGVPVDYKDGTERTPLSYASGQGYADTVQLLIDHGNSPTFIPIIFC